MPARAPLPAVALLRARRAGSFPRPPGRERAHREIVQRFHSRGTGLRARVEARSARAAWQASWEVGRARGEAPSRVSDPQAAHRRMPRWEISNGRAARANGSADSGSPHTGVTAWVWRPYQPSLGPSRGAVRPRRHPRSIHLGIERRFRSSVLPGGKLWEAGRHRGKKATRAARWSRAARAAPAGDGGRPRTGVKAG